MCFERVIGLEVDQLPTGSLTDWLLLLGGPKKQFTSEQLLLRGG